MAQTTTAYNACDVEILCDDDVGDLRDVSGSSNQVSWSFSITPGEAFTFGSDFPIRKVCGQDASVTWMVVFSTAADEGWDILKNWWFTSNGASRTFGWSMPNGDSGSDRIIGEWVLTELSSELTAGEGSPIMVSGTLLPDGEITLSAIAT